jgi:hypothetical protein
MAMMKKLWSLSGLAVELGMDRRTVGRVMATASSDGAIQGHPAWHMTSALRALADDGQASASQHIGNGPLAHFAERLDTWREIYGNDDRDDMACPIGEAAAMFGEEPETLLCWLRCGMPFVKAGSWETGDGFLLSPPWVFDWKMSLVCLAKFSGDPISAQKLRVRF